MLSLAAANLKCQLRLAHRHVVRKGCYDLARNDLSRPALDLGDALRLPFHFCRTRNRHRGALGLVHVRRQLLARVGEQQVGEWIQYHQLGEHTSEIAIYFTRADLMIRLDRRIRKCSRDSRVQESLRRRVRRSRKVSQVPSVLEPKAQQTTTFPPTSSYDLP
jgi:hypothetical protein